MRVSMGIKNWGYKVNSAQSLFWGSLPSGGREKYMGYDTTVLRRLTQQREGKIIIGTTEKGGLSG